MKNVILTIVIASLFSIHLSTANPVSEEEACKIAIAYYKHIARASVSDHSVQDAFPVIHNNRVTLYVFNFTSGGFVIVAADDACIPVLGYSEENPFPAGMSCPAVKDWMEGYSRQIDQIIKGGFSNRETIEQWEAIRLGIFPQKDREIGPLCTTKWDQGCYYNECCPAVSGGPCGHVVTGCVPTAMAQLLKYHNFPPRGIGMFSYMHPVFGMLTADFGSTDYDWGAMPDSLSAANIPVATIMYHAGVSVYTDYRINLSGSMTEFVPNAFKEYFNYDPGIQLHYMRDFEDPEDWKALIRSDLDQLLPVLYDGYIDSEMGHGFICDGYRLSDGKFHFNWGWGGYADGWFAIGELNPDPPEITFNRHNTAVTRIKPYNPDLVVRITSLESNMLLKPGSEAEINAMTIIGIPDRMKITVDGMTVATGTSAELTYHWHPDMADVGSHQVKAWSFHGEDSVSYEINLNVNNEWTSQSSSFQTPMRAIISISAVDSNVVWAVPRDLFEGGGPVQEFTRTLDGGEHWTAGTINDCEGLSVGMIFAVSDLKAYAPMFKFTIPSSHRGIYVTTDGGSTWMRQASATFGSPLSHPNCIHFFNENEGWCMGDPVPQSRGYEFEIYTTTDGGDNWVTVPSVNKPDPLSQEYAIQAYCAVKDTLWFGTKKGRIYKSTDKGYTWSVHEVPDMVNQAVTPVFRNGSHGLVHNFFNDVAIYTGEEGIICESFDGGETWSKLNTSGPLYWTDLAWIPGTENTWISTGGRLPLDCGASVSYDGGHSWKEIQGTKGARFRNMAWLNPNCGWAGSYNLSEAEGGMFRFAGDMLGPSAINKPDTGTIPFSVFPNPFSSYTTVEFSIPESGHVTLAVYDISGRLLERILSERLAPGEHHIGWKPGPMKPGVYFMRIETDKSMRVQKVIIIHNPQ